MKKITLCLPDDTLCGVISLVKGNIQNELELKTDTFNFQNLIKNDQEIVVNFETGEQSIIDSKEENNVNLDNR